MSDTDVGHDLVSQIAYYVLLKSGKAQVGPQFTEMIQFGNYFSNGWFNYQLSTDFVITFWQLKMDDFAAKQGRQLFMSSKFEQRANRYPLAN